MQLASSYGTAPAVRSKTAFLSFLGIGTGVLLQLVSGTAAANTITVSGTPVTRVTVGHLYWWRPTVTDSNKSAKLKYGINHKPAWAHFDSTTGDLSSGALTAASVGVYSNVSISVTDGTTTKATAPFNITVAAASGAGGGSTSNASGVLVFGGSSYSAAQNAASVTTTLSRTGGSSGIATVKYATANGSATAGTDYLSTTGTVSWAAGDSSAKTITVPLKTVAAYTGSRTFTLAISSPSSGAAIGTPASTTVSINGSGSTTTTGSSPSTGLAIKVKGNTLVDGKGNVVQLRGADASGLEFVAIQGWSPKDPWGGQTPNYAAMARWKLNAVRIPLNEASWLGLTTYDWPSASGKSGTSRSADPGSNYRQAVVNAVNNAVAAGLYVILDLHMNSPDAVVPGVSGKVPTSPTAQNVMADADHSAAFWTSVASTFKSNPAVIFDLFNEPHIDGFANNIDYRSAQAWAALRDGGTATQFTSNNATINQSFKTAGMQALLNAVRATGATNVVMSAGVSWAQDMSQWVTYAPVDPLKQLAASWHAYPEGSSGTNAGLPGYGTANYTWAKAILAAGYPVIIGETGDKSAAGTTGAPLMTNLLPWTDQNGVSVLGWSWNTWNSADNDLIKDAAGTPTDGYGTAYHSWTVNHAGTVVAGGGSGGTGGTTGGTGGGGTTTGGGGTTASLPNPCISGLNSASTSVALTGSSVTGASTAMSGRVADMGAPLLTVDKGLSTMTDQCAHFSKHGMAAAAATMPSALAATALPYIPNIQVLSRRDTVIMYFPSVSGAADYRAYAVTSGVSFTDTVNGKQPRGAVIACAGFRQHSFAQANSSGKNARELQQAIELPGFVAKGNYTIIVEATSTACPFTGLPADTDATITSQFKEDSTYKNTDFHAIFESFATMKSQYGNEIINGQEPLSSWASRVTSPMGEVVPAKNASSPPGDPVVLARSAIAVQTPAADEATNAPVFDVGSNAFTDDFNNDLVVDPNTITTNPDYGPGAALAPYAQIPGAWTFWGRYMNNADGEDTVPGSGGATVWRGSGFHGFQVFQRHGRLYTTFGDAGQDIGGTMSFASQRVLPMQLDTTKYVHSMWRVNSDASHRRYWTWAICGASSRDQLMNTTTHIPVIRPIITENAFTPGGDNPTAKLGPLQASASPKECLTIIQEGRPESPRSDGGLRAGGRLTAQIHPAGAATGIIALGNKFTDSPAPNGATSLGFRYKTDSAGNYKGPLIEPFDQTAPLTHYDVFLRPDRLVVFINGRQGFCVDLSGHPLTMKYGMVTYGDLIYHSALEWQEVSNANGALYHHQLNAPIASSRVWDAIYESDEINIPSQLTFDATACFKPATTAVQ